MCCYALDHQRILEDSLSILAEFFEVLCLCNMVHYRVTIKQVLIASSMASLITAMGTTLLKSYESFMSPGI